jgi:hypothetical protein
LIHIGLHKTGTTWLQQSIFNDERFGFARVRPNAIVDDAFLTGNPYSFDAQRAAELLRPFIDDATAAGRVPVLSHERLSGNPVLDRWDARVVADRLRETLPDARVLIVIREQRSMMLSMYKQYVRTSGTLPVERLWRDRRPEEQRWPAADLAAFEYEHLIAYYRSRFGEEAVLALPYELIQHDPAAFAGRILSFAGLEPAAEVPAGRRNVALPGAMVGAIRFSNKVLRAFGLLDPFGGPVTNGKIADLRARSIRTLIRRTPNALSRPFDRRLQQAVARVADGRFDDSNRRTAALIGFDLGALGYDVGCAPTDAADAR